MSAPPGGPALIPGVKHIVAVGSGKGGVGKSTVAVNLAAAIAQTGLRPGLLDADIYGPSIPMMLGLDDLPAMREVDGRKLIVPLTRYGLKTMSLGFLLPPGAPPVIWRGPMVGGAVKQMLGDVDWGELDYLIVDLPPGTGDAQLTLAQVVPLTGAVIVMTSQDLALNIANKALAMFRKLNVPVIGIVENMGAFVCPTCGTATPIFSRGAGEKVAAEMEAPFLGSVPLDPAIVDNGDEGVPTVVAAPHSAPAAAFRRIADAVVARVGGGAASEEQPGWLNKLRGGLGQIGDSARGNGVRRGCDVPGDDGVPHPPPQFWVQPVCMGQYYQCFLDSS